MNVASYLAAIVMITIGAIVALGAFLMLAMGAGALGIPAALVAIGFLGVGVAVARLTRAIARDDELVRARRDD